VGLLAAVALARRLGERLGAGRPQHPAHVQPLAIAAERPTEGAMSTAPIVYPSPAEFVGRAITFGLLAVAGIAAIVIAGAWWASCIGAVGLLCAMAGLVVSVLALLDEDQPASWRASRPVALGLATLSVAAIVVALVAV
jgi:hypothetical protein